MVSGPIQPAVDKATRKHDGAGDFPAWLAANRDAPRRTVFIKGNHEDFVSLDAQSNREILPNLLYLPNGQTIDLVNGSSEMIRVGGIGGCHGPSNYERPSHKLQGYARRHFTRDEVESLVSHGTRQKIDIVLTHDAPGGVRFVRHRGGEFISEAGGLAEALSGVRPRYVFSVITTRGLMPKFPSLAVSASIKLDGRRTSWQSASRQMNQTGN